MIGTNFLFQHKFKTLLVSAFIISTVAILGATLYPSDFSLPKGLWEKDKLGHGIMFFGWTLIYGLFLFVRKKDRPSLTLIFTVSAAFGLAIEVLQFILPAGRSAELYDFLADVIGSLVAIILLHQFFKRFHKKD